MYLFNRIKFISSLIKAIYHGKLLLLPLLGGIATLLCIQFGFYRDMGIVVSFFFVGTFFAFSVVMNSVNARRFKAMDEISLIKSNLLSLAHILSVHGISGKKNNNKLVIIVETLQVFLGEKHKKKYKKDILRIDSQIKNIETLAESLREVHFSAPEISRIHQYLAQVNFSFEKLITIKESRTPRALKLFSYISLPISVLVLAPDFANLGYFGILIAMIIGFLLGLLLMIQNDIEDPFTGDIDDVNFDFIDRFKERISKI